MQHTAHWGIDDPGEVEGDEPTRMAAFRAARDEIRSRVRLLLTTASRDEHAHPTSTALPDEI